MIQINGTLTISDPVRLNGRVVVNQQIVVGGVVMTLATYLRLVQVTGDDTFSVMSQEAVTRLMQEKLVSGQNIKTINGESVLGSGNIKVSGGGGLSNYDFTELSAPTISGGACTITFAADQRNAVEFSTNADLAIALVSNNKADNYMWITNSHATTAIDITFSSILFGSTAINDIKGTASIPSVEAGETLEIGVYVTNSKARITSRIL